MENNITTAVGVTGGHVQVRRADLSTDWIIRREYKKELDVGVVIDKLSPFAINFLAVRASWELSVPTDHQAVGLEFG